MTHVDLETEVPHALGTPVRHRSSYCTNDAHSPKSPLVWHSSSVPRNKLGTPIPSSRKSWHSSSASRSKLGTPFPSLRTNLHSNSRTMWHRSTTHANNMTVQFLSKRRQTKPENPRIRKVRPARLSPRKLNASASSHMTLTLSIARVRVCKIINRRSRWSGFVVKPCARILIMSLRKRFVQI